MVAPESTPALLVACCSSPPLAGASSGWIGSIEPRPGHLLVVAHGERFLLRPLEVEGETWRLAALSPGEVPLPLDPGDLETSGLFGVGVAVVHDLVRGKQAQLRRIR